MKIEMAEQMFASYLQNCEGCQLVQTNWSPTKINIGNVSSEDKNTVAKMICEIEQNDSFKGIDIFKKNTIDQFISQCEIDVIGTKIDSGIIEKVYLVDTAFHENGLGYKNKEATVLKKLVRSCIISNIFFKDIPANIIFATPKCANKTEKDINIKLSILKPILKSHYPDCNVEFCVNKAFSNVIEEINKQEPDIHNDNDLYIRAYKLSKFSNSVIPGKMPPIPSSSSAKAGTTKGTNKDTIMNGLMDLEKRGLLTSSIIADLKTSAYSKKMFHMPIFPILIDVTDTTYEFSRFYKDSIVLSGNEYRVCSQWIPLRIRSFIDWMDAVVNGTVK